MQATNFEAYSEHNCTKCDFVFRAVLTVYHISCQALNSFDLSYVLRVVTVTNNVAHTGLGGKNYNGLETFFTCYLTYVPTSYCN